MQKILQLQKGITAVNKPLGVTSHDVVAMIRKKFKGEKVGHAGTLDPLASGVLVVAVGRDFTKKLAKITQMDKEYLVTIVLGLTSLTDDAQGLTSCSIGSLKHLVRLIPSREDIERVLPGFLGEIKQVAPAYSAVKVRGKEAYKRARQGENFTLGYRCVRIDRIEIISYNFPDLELKVTTGSGVYIRSLARDIGQKLGVGGYVGKLTRTRVGKYDLKDCLKISEL